jgi:hypothetical protein
MNNETDNTQELTQQLIMMCLDKPPHVALTALLLAFGTGALAVGIPLENVSVLVEDTIKDIYEQNSGAFV